MTFPVEGSLLNYPAGTWIWIPDNDTVWRKAEVVEPCKNGFLKVRVEGLEIEKQLPHTTITHLCNLEVFSSEGLIGLDNLTHLTHLHEAAVLNSLNLRFDVDKIYTFTGPILIAVNPFKLIDGLYSNQAVKDFLEAPDGTPKRKDPHAFATASVAYHGLCQSKSSQTILISGESGAGKTESTKFVMKFLALAGSEDWNNRSHIEKQVLQSNPLLETLGNAKTLRNDNSSRFGKFIEMQFNLVPKPGQEELQGRLVGARIHTYLLETVRVCHQHEGERSFHSFYQLCAAAAEAAPKAGVYHFPSLIKYDAPEAKPCTFDLSKFTSYAHFRYLTQSSCSRLVRIDDAKEFEYTILAMQTIGIKYEEQVSLLNLIGAILYLGNILFTPPEGNTEASEIHPKCLKFFEIAASLLGVTQASLCAALTIRTLVAQGEEYKIPLKVHEAEEIRDSLAKALYGTAFLKIVKRTNESIGYRNDVDLFCGVLDIFGFECFDVNSFEQLCINFTNERLQQFFNGFIFKCEEKLYKAENIPWSALDFPDNRDCVELLEQKNIGLFAMLDEECMVPKGSDQSLCNKMKIKHNKNHRFRSIKTQPEWFIVNHFAGPVSYCITGFLDKNRDQLSADAQQCILQSSSEFIQNLFRGFLKRGGTAQTSQQDNNGGAPNTARKRLLTVSGEFRTQLDYLMMTVAATEPHFIRCIKPNHNNLPEEFDRKAVTEQLRYGGVLQAVEVSRAGYPVRLPHREAISEYRALCSSEVRKKLASNAANPHQHADMMMTQLDSQYKFPNPTHCAVSWAVGKTLVFLKHESYEILSAGRALLRKRASITIQRYWKGTVQRRFYLRTKACTLFIQASVRGWLARRKVHAMRCDAAAKKIQVCAIRFLRRLRYKQFCCGIYLIEIFYRAFVARRKAVEIEHSQAATKIQSVWRSYRAKTYFRHLRYGAIKAQLRWKKILAKRELRRLKVEQRDTGALKKQLAHVQEVMRQWKQKWVEAEAANKKLTLEYYDLEAQLNEMTELKNHAVANLKCVSTNKHETFTKQSENFDNVIKMHTKHQQDAAKFVTVSPELTEQKEDVNRYRSEVLARLAYTILERDAAIDEALDGITRTAVAETKAELEGVIKNRHQAIARLSYASLEIESVLQKAQEEALKVELEETKAALNKEIRLKEQALANLKTMALERDVATQEAQDKGLALEKTLQRLAPAIHQSGIEGAETLLLDLASLTSFKCLEALGGSPRSDAVCTTRTPSPTARNQLSNTPRLNKKEETEFSEEDIMASTETEVTDHTPSIVKSRNKDKPLPAQDQEDIDNTTIGLKNKVAKLENLLAAKGHELSNLTSHYVALLKSKDQTNQFQRTPSTLKDKSKGTSDALRNQQESSKKIDILILGHTCTHLLISKLLQEFGMAESSPERIVEETGALLYYKLNYKGNVLTIGEVEVEPSVIKNSTRIPASNEENALFWASCSKFVVIVFDMADIQSYRWAYQYLKMTARNPRRMCFSYTGTVQQGEIAAVDTAEARDYALRSSCLFQEAQSLTSVLSFIYDQLIHLSPTNDNASDGPFFSNHHVNGTSSPSPSTASFYPKGIMTPPTPNPAFSNIMNKIQTFFGNNPHLSASGSLSFPSLEKNNKKSSSTLGTILFPSLQHPGLMSSNMLSPKPNGHEGYSSARTVASSNSGELLYEANGAVMPVMELPENVAAVTCLAFGSELRRRDSYLLAAACKDGSITIYRVMRTLKEKQLYSQYATECTTTVKSFGAEIPLCEGTTALCLDDTERTNSTDEEEIQRAEVYLQLFGHSRAVTQMLFSHDDEFLITASVDKSVRFWSLETGDILKVFADSAFCVAIVFLPFNPSLFIVSNANSILRVVDSRDGKVIQRLKPDSEIRSLTFDETGMNCLAGSRNGTLHVLEVKDAGKLEFKLRNKVSKAAITCITYIPTRDYTVNSLKQQSRPRLVVNACDSTLSIVDCIYSQVTGLITGLVVQRRLKVAHSLLPLRSCFSHAGGGWIISASEDRLVYIYSLAPDGNYQNVVLRRHHAPVVTVAVNQANTILASADSCGKLILWRWGYPLQSV